MSVESSAVTVDDQFTLSATSFNWTPDVIRAERDAGQIVRDVVASGLVDVVELEPGQLWRSFPVPADAEVETTRDQLAAAGGRVSMVGASIDEWRTPTIRRDDVERWEFLRPQIIAAHRVGAGGFRLPLGQASEALVDQILGLAHDLDLIFYEEAQGPDTLTSERSARHFETLARQNDPRRRLLLDTSLLMPALPTTYLDRMRSGGLDRRVLDRLEHGWSDPETADVVVDHLRSGAVPPAIHTLFMNLMVRFGRANASDFRDIMPFVGAVHAKLWDLHDDDARVSAPLRELAQELTSAGVPCFVASEWGGHEWLDTDATDVTRSHLHLIRQVFAAPSQS